MRHHHSCACSNCRSRERGSNPGIRDSGGYGDAGINGDAACCCFRRFDTGKRGKGDGGASRQENLAETASQDSC